MTIVAEYNSLIEAGQSSGRLWLYSNYHCNLSCRYCLTSSSPQSPVRGLSKEQMLEAVKQARNLGFTSVGITGGEPFLMSWMPELIHDIAQTLPVIVLTNGTMLKRKEVRSHLLKCVDLPVQIQVSIDDPDPTINDINRGDGSFHRALAGIPWLVDRGVSIRISSTRIFKDSATHEQHDEKMNLWMKHLGLNPNDHVGRTMVQRGQAAVNNLGASVEWEMLPADLTLTRMGAFYSPFGPTYIEGKLQTDMLLSRTILPLEIPLRHLVTCLNSMESSVRTPEAKSGFV